MPSHLVVLSGLFPDRSDDVDHLPMRNPFPVRAFPLFALGAGNGAFHAVGHALLRADGNVRLHSALPQRKLTELVGRIAGPAHAVLVDAHVAIGHRDRIDIRIDECRYPRPSRPTRC